jgi:hypothetical protein
MGVLRGRTLRPEAQDYLVQQWQEEQDKAQEEFWNSDEFKALVAEAEATKPGQEPTLSQGDPFKGVVGTAAPRTTTPPAIATLNDLFKFKPPAKDYKPYTPSVNIGFAEPGMSLAAQSTLNFLQTKPAEFLPGQYLYVAPDGTLTNRKTSQPVYVDPKTGEMTTSRLGESNRAVIPFSSPGETGALNPQTVTSFEGYLRSNRYPVSTIEEWNAYRDDQLARQKAAETKATEQDAFNKEHGEEVQAASISSAASTMGFNVTPQQSMGLVRMATPDQPTVTVQGPDGQPLPLTVAPSAAAYWTEGMRLLSAGQYLLEQAPVIGPLLGGVAAWTSTVYNKALTHINYNLMGLGGIIRPILGIDRVQPFAYDPRTLEKLSDEQVFMRQLYGLPIQYTYDPMLTAARAFRADAANDAAWKDIWSGDAFDNGYQFMFNTGPRTAQAVLDINAEITAKINTRDSYRRQAASALKAGDSELALEYTVKAVRLDGIDRPLDPYYYYSWSAEPWRYEPFIRAVAQYELKLGRPLKGWEVMNVADRFVNPDLEMAMGVIFDVSNVLPMPFVDKLFGGASSLVKSIPESLKWADPKNFNAFARLYRWNVRKSAESTGSWVTRWLVAGPFERLAHKSEAEIDEAFDIFAEVFVDRNPARMHRLIAPVTEGGLGFSKRELDVLENMVKLTDNTWIDNLLKRGSITPERAARLKALMGQMSPANWKAMRQAGINAIGLDSLDREIAKTARRLGVSVPEAGSEAEALFIRANALDAASLVSPRKSLTALAGDLRETYTRAHRPVAGLNLFDDSVLYYLAYKSGVRATNKRSLELIRTFVKSTSGLRNVWVFATLSLRPAWFARNVIDTTFRMMLGTPGAAHTMAHIYEMLPEMQKVMTIPEAALTTTITSSGETFRSVSQRILAGEKFNRLSPFKFMSEEWDALRAMAGTRRGLFKLFGMPTDALKAFGRGFQDLNTLYEFTARTAKLWELYVPKYARVSSYELAQLAVALQARGGTADALTHLTLLWEASGNNPELLGQMLSRLVGGDATDSYMSILMNETCLKAIAGLPVEQRQLVVKRLIEAVEGAFSPDEAFDVVKFFDDYKARLTEELRLKGDPTVELQGTGEMAVRASAPEGMPVRMADLTQHRLETDADVAYFMHAGGPDGVGIHPTDHYNGLDDLVKRTGLTQPEIDDLLERNVLNEVTVEGVAGYEWNPRMQDVFDHHVVRPDVPSASSVDDFDSRMDRMADDIEEKEAREAEERLTEGEIGGESRAASGEDLRMRPTLDRAPQRRYVALRDRWSVLRKSAEMQNDIMVKLHPELKPRADYIHNAADVLVSVNRRVHNWMKFHYPGPLTHSIELSRVLWSKANDMAAFLQRGTNTLFEKLSGSVLSGAVDKEITELGGKVGLTLQDIMGTYGMRLETTTNGVISVRWFDDVGEEIKGWATTSRSNVNSLMKEMFGGDVYAAALGKGPRALPDGSLRKLLEDVPYSEELIIDLQKYIQTGEVRGDVAELFSALPATPATPRSTPQAVLDKFQESMPSYVQVRRVPSLLDDNGQVLPTHARWMTRRVGDHFELVVENGKIVLEVADNFAELSPEGVAKLLQHEMGHPIFYAYKDECIQLWAEKRHFVTGARLGDNVQLLDEQVAKDFAVYVERGSTGDPTIDAFFKRVLTEDDDSWIGATAHGLSGWAQNAPSTPKQKASAKQLWGAYTAQANPDGSTLREMYGSVMWRDREVLESPQTLLAYLRETANDAARLKFQNSTVQAINEQIDQLTRFLNYADTNWEKLGIERPVVNRGYSPAPIRKSMYSRGTMTWLLDNEHGVANQARLFSFLDEMKRGMLEQLGANPALARTLPKDQLDLLAEIGGDAVGAKGRAVDIAMNGGEHPAIGTWQGALPQTNEYMLDYGDFSNFDKAMKGIYPFWMFPSRSFSLWAKYLMSHPWLPAMYAKYTDWTKRTLVSEGFFNTKGEALPSMVGMVKIPGTDVWFNPTSALSFRYPIQIFDRLANYEDEEYSDLNPLQSFMTKFCKIARVANLDLPPWIIWGLNKIGAVDPNSLPNYAPFAPLQLMPRTYMLSFMEKMLKVDSGPVMDFMHPDVGWKDYLVETWMYEDALKIIMDDTKTQAEKLAAVDKVRAALGYQEDKELKYGKAGYILNPRENDPYWQQASAAINNQEWVKDTIGYFTGVFPKPGTDAAILMYGMRNYRNYLRDAINDGLMTTIFKLDPDAESRYNDYIEKGFKTPYGSIAGFYNAGRYVHATDPRTGKDQTVYGQDRRELMALTLHEDVVTQEYYAAITQLVEARDKELEGVAHGDRSAITNDIWTRYFAARKAIDEDEFYQDARRTWLVGHRPESMIFDGYRDQFWIMLRETYPQWDTANDEPYADYLTRVEQWQTELPYHAQMLISVMMNDNVVRSLRDREGNVTIVNGNEVQLAAEGAVERYINLDKLKLKLLEEATPDGFVAWRDSNRSLYAAQDAVYDELYTNKFYADTTGLTGYALEVAQADWLSSHQMPTEQMILDAIHQKYGDKWTDEQIRESWEKADKMSIAERMAPRTEEEAMSQEVWDVLSWIGLGSVSREKFNIALVKAGGEPDSIQTWYDTSGMWGQIGDSKVNGKWQAFHDAVVAAGANLGLQEPSLDQMRILAQVQDENKEFQEIVNTKFGEDFYTTLTVYGLTSDKTEKKALRAENPSIDGYYDAKDTFACDHETWAKFYYPTYPGCSKWVGPGGTGSTNSGGGKTKKVGGGGGGGGGGASVSVAGHWIPLGARRSNAGKALGSGGSSVKPVYPAGFVPVAGTVAVSEIERLASSAISLSSPTVNWLMTLKQRHPEWKKFLDALLTDNSTVST